MSDRDVFNCSNSVLRHAPEVPLYVYLRTDEAVPYVYIRIDEAVP